MDRRKLIHNTRSVPRFGVSDDVSRKVTTLPPWWLTGAKPLRVSLVDEGVLSREYHNRSRFYLWSWGSELMYNHRLFRPVGECRSLKVLFNLSGNFWNVVFLLQIEYMVDSRTPKRTTLNPTVTGPFRTSGAGDSPVKCPCLNAEIKRLV